MELRYRTIKTLNKHWPVAETSVFDRMYMFSCVVSTDIRYPIVIKVTAFLMSLKHCPVSFGFIWYILIPKSPPSKTLPIKLKDFDGTCIRDTSHNVSCTLFSTSKFQTLTYSWVCIFYNCILCSAYFAGIIFIYCRQKSVATKLIIVHMS